MKRVSSSAAATRVVFGFFEQDDGLESEDGTEESMASSVVIGFPIKRVSSSAAAADGEVLDFFERDDCLESEEGIEESMASSDCFTPLLTPFAICSPSLCVMVDRGGVRVSLELQKVKKEKLETSAGFSKYFGFSNERENIIFFRISKLQKCPLPVTPINAIKYGI